MKWSKSHLYTLKDNPADADLNSHKLLVRSGMIRQLSQGVYTYHYLALKSLKKIKNIVRKHMNELGGLEILMPFTHPKSIWTESGRWDEMGQSLLKFKTRSEKEHCLGATHEEVVTDYMRKDIKSYRDLPCLIYQIQTKYRDEIRPRFGLIRAKEFLMKDAYSFDTSQEKALEAYQNVKKAYQKIFEEIGLNFAIVNADSGAIGGSHSEEFHILSEKGQDVLLVSEKGDFAANQEICPALDEQTKKLQAEKKPPLEKIEKFHTPDIKTIDDLAKFLKISAQKLVKTLFVKADGKNYCVLLRGNDTLNLIKLQKLINSKELPITLSPKEVLELAKAPAGSCGPVNINADVVMDTAVECMTNYAVGANEKDYHLKNVNHERDFKVYKAGDLRQAIQGDLNPKGEGFLKEIQGIEAGHIFYLDSKYSKKMKLKYLDEKGKNEYVQMGCYGIGISRILQASIEQSHDEYGIKWLKSISPFDLHLCLLDPTDETSLNLSEKIENVLKSKNKEIFIDDREERPGVKLKDADLLGFPYRIVIGKKSLSNKEVEFMDRQTRQTKNIPLDNLESFLEGLF